jgi:stage II sporulation protein P
MRRTGRNNASRILRRAAALFFATITVWLLTMTANLGAAADTFRSLGENSELVKAALRAELGGRVTGNQPLDSLTFWQKLVLSESSLLSAGTEEAAAQETPAQTAPQQSAQPTATLNPEDNQELQPTKTAQGDAVERTLTASKEENYDSAAGVFVFNRTSQTVDVAAVAAATVDITLGGSDSPQILIMHTHGSEAYAQDADDVYVESDTARTIDTRYNVVRVGDEMQRIFTELGFNVIHDRSLYDYPSYSGAYDRSKAAVEDYLAKYPSIRIVLDVHRDALVAADGTVYKAVTTIDGVKTAQVLLVVGSDDNGLPHPKWRENLTLAVKIQQTMNSLWPTLARPITLRTSRFNQQMTNGSLLVEIGCHGNTLQEALAGARLFARAAGQVLSSLDQNTS